MPDIDVDFEDERREEVLNIYLKIKSAIRDVARAMEIDLEIVDKMTKSIGAKNLTNLQEAIANSEILNLYNQDKEYKLFFKMVEKLIGLPRQTGTHAAGLVLSNGKI
ncbi:hypothetical protein FQA39_LY12849 [Lamprigera yunnana]|nr:hypothetical protein FQA39_LY12849 [Lamprigera yunnana]